MTTEVDSILLYSRFGNAITLLEMSPEKRLLRGFTATSPSCMLLDVKMPQVSAGPKALSHVRQSALAASFPFKDPLPSKVLTNPQEPGGM